MKELDQSGYKYLGVLTGSNILHGDMKEKLRKEYFLKVKLVAKSKLYGGHLIRVVNVCAASVVRCSAGVLDTELRVMDVRKRKLLTDYVWSFSHSK